MPSVLPFSSGFLTTVNIDREAENLTAFIDEIKTLTKDLNNLGVSWALVGALACSVYAEPRTTRDIDITVALSGRNELDNFVKKLTALGYFNPQLLMHATPVITMGCRVFIQIKNDYSIPIDLLNNNCGIENEIVAAATTIEILPSLSLPVARLGHLMAMKILSQDSGDRIRDRSDIMAMLAIVDSTEISLCRAAILLITDRGFHRGRNLNAILDDFLVLSGRTFH